MLQIYFTNRKTWKNILIILFEKKRVCKSWLTAVYDEVLWYHIDLSDLNLNLKKLWKFFRHRCFSNAKSIRMIGNLKKSIFEMKRLCGLF